MLINARNTRNKSEEYKTSIPTSKDFSAVGGPCPCRDTNSVIGALDHGCSRAIFFVDSRETVVLLELRSRNSLSFTQAPSLASGVCGNASRRRSWERVQECC